MGGAGESQAASQVLLLVPVSVHNSCLADFQYTSIFVLASLVALPCSNGVSLSVLAARKVSWKVGACRNT